MRRRPSAGASAASDGGSASTIAASVPATVSRRNARVPVSIS
ncbi:MAG: hypothetical protein R2752_08210 [Vicinamibacterales bacterium]